MALTYDQSAALMTDPDFRGRVKVACLEYATSLFAAATPVANNTAAIRWATICFQQPDVIAGQVQPPTVMDPAVQADGAAISDTALQAAVEGTVNKML